jgi:hypothetical protein
MFNMSCYVAVDETTVTWKQERTSLGKECDDLTVETNDGGDGPQTTMTKLWHCVPKLSHEVSQLMMIAGHPLSKKMEKRATKKWEEEMIGCDLLTTFEAWNHPSKSYRLWVSLSEETHYPRSRHPFRLWKPKSPQLL